MVLLTIIMTAALFHIQTHSFLDKNLVGVALVLIVIYPIYASEDNYYLFHKMSNEMLTVYLCKCQTKKGIISSL